MDISIAGSAETLATTPNLFTPLIDARQNPARESGTVDFLATGLHVSVPCTRRPKTLLAMATGKFALVASWRG
jgi:hypothetical protein